MDFCGEKEKHHGPDDDAYSHPSRNNPTPHARAAAAAAAAATVTPSGPQRSCPQRAGLGSVQGPRRKPLKTLMPQNDFNPCHPMAPKTATSCYGLWASALCMSARMRACAYAGVCTYGKVRAHVNR